MVPHRSQRLFATVLAWMSVSTTAVGEQSPVWFAIEGDSNALDKSALSDAIGKELNCEIIEDRDLAHSGEIIVTPMSLGQKSVAFLPPDRIAPLRRVETRPMPTAKVQPEVQSPGLVDTDRLHSHSVNLAVWHGLLELHPDAETSRFAVHVGIGYGRVGASRGFAFDALHHRNDLELQGVASSIGWTRVNKSQGLAPQSVGGVIARYPRSCTGSGRERRHPVPSPEQ